MNEGDPNAPTNQRVPVPREVFEGLEAVRRSGATNMLDRPRVAQLAFEMSFDAAAEWVRENRGSYARAVLDGFEIQETP
jgi:hypothetical protein